MASKNPRVKLREAQIAIAIAAVGSMSPQSQEASELVKKLQGTANRINPKQAGIIIKAIDAAFLKLAYDGPTRRASIDMVEFLKGFIASQEKRPD